MKLFLTKIKYFIIGVIASVFAGLLITWFNADTKDLIKMVNSASKNIMNY